MAQSSKYQKNQQVVANLETNLSLKLLESNATTKFDPMFNNDQTQHFLLKPKGNGRMRKLNNRT